MTNELKDVYTWYFGKKYPNGNQTVSVYWNVTDNGKSVTQSYGDEKDMLSCRGFELGYYKNKEKRDYSYILVKNDNFEKDMAMEGVSKTNTPFGVINVKMEGDLINKISELQRKFQDRIKDLIDNPSKHFDVVKGDNEGNILAFMKRYRSAFGAQPDKFRGPTFNYNKSDDEGNVDTYCRFYINERTQFYVDGKPVDMNTMYLKRFKAYFVADMPAIHFCINDKGMPQTIITKIPLKEVYATRDGPIVKDNLIDSLAEVNINA